MSSQLPSFNLISYIVAVSHGAKANLVASTLSVIFIDQEHIINSLKKGHYVNHPLRLYPPSPALGSSS